MHLKNYFALYKHTLQWFIGIMNNEQSPPTHLCFCLTQEWETSNILMMASMHGTVHRICYLCYDVHMYPQWCGIPLQVLDMLDGCVATDSGGTEYQVPMGP